MKFRSIAVEGPIGVGKTSFVELLARKTEAQKVLEKIDNPFLRDFYQDKQGSAFQAQLFFLLSRYRQLMELGQRDLFHQVALCDYIFPKDKIFAYLNLDDSELLIYDKLYAMLEPQVPKPDLVIFLQAETARLVERIKRRRRDYEA
jgi:deoxyguanosine kinase